MPNKTISQKNGIGRKDERRNDNIQSRSRYGKLWAKTATNSEAMAQRPAGLKASQKSHAAMRAKFDRGGYILTKSNIDTRGISKRKQVEQVAKAKKEKEKKEAELKEKVRKEAELKLVEAAKVAEEREKENRRHKEYAAVFSKLAIARKRFTAQSKIPVPINKAKQMIATAGVLKIPVLIKTTESFAQRSDRIRRGQMARRLVKKDLVPKTVDVIQKEQNMLEVVENEEKQKEKFMSDGKRTEPSEVQAVKGMVGIFEEKPAVISTPSTQCSSPFTARSIQRNSPFVTPTPMLRAAAGRVIKTTKITLSQWADKRRREELRNSKKEILWPGQVRAANGLIAEKKKRKELGEDDPHWVEFEKHMEQRRTRMLNAKKPIKSKKVEEIVEIYRDPPSGEEFEAPSPIYNPPVPVITPEQVTQRKVGGFASERSDKPNQKYRAQCTPGPSSRRPIQYSSPVTPRTTLSDWLRNGGEDSIIEGDYTTDTDSIRDIERSKIRSEFSTPATDSPLRHKRTVAFAAESSSNTTPLSKKANLKQPMAFMAPKTPVGSVYHGKAGESARWCMEPVEELRRTPARWIFGSKPSTAMPKMKRDVWDDYGDSDSDSDESTSSQKQRRDEWS